MSEEAQGVQFEGADDDLVDLSVVEEATFETLPKGMYVFEIEDLEYQISQRSGNPMWKWTLVVTDHAEASYNGRKLFLYTVWKGDGLPLTKRSVAAVFPQIATGPFSPKAFSENPDNWMGKKCRGRVDIQNYRPEGEKVAQRRNNVKQLFGGPDPGEF